MTNVFHIQCLFMASRNSALLFSGAEKTGLVPHRSQKTSPALSTCFAELFLAKLT
ncbi:MAG: hypothetical protein [Bacteriophage sp.]|nr:MAG: hypothetical protein [Bacteriophage sp.]